MPRRRKLRTRVIRCKRCTNVLDPNGQLHHISYGPATGYYCRACFFTHIAFKCRRCGGAYLRAGMPERGESSTNLCPGCARRRATAPSVRHVNWGRRDELAGTTFESIKSERRFGIEIETAQCNHVNRIRGKTPFGAKHDSTVTGKEFDSPILSGDEGLAVVSDFCDIAKRRRWAVNEDCGTHIHLDMRREGEDSLRAIAAGYFFTYPSWAKLVDPVRTYNDFCLQPDYCDRTMSNPTPFRQLAGETNRYTFINIAAYCRHRTFEIRGLEGTFDKNLLANWIISHLTFADFCATLTIEQVTRLFNGTEKACWHNLKKHVLGDTARYFGRLRAKRIKSEH